MTNILKLMLFLNVLLVLSCTEDKGNYSYRDKQVITVEGIPQERACLSGSDYIDLHPVITSSIDGNIDGENPKYAFLYEQMNSEGEWKTVAQTKDLYMLASLSSGKHAFRFSVTDKENGITTLQLFYIQSTTVTSEGWLVLCNEGPEERVRLDMLTQIDMERIIPTHNVLLKAEGVPEMFHACNLGFYSNQTPNRNKIVIMSENSAYLVPTADEQGYTEITTLNEYNELKQSLFASSPDDHLVCFTPVTSTARIAEHDAVLCVSKEGNAFAWNTVASYSSFENPINTSQRGEKPEYRVAPFIGASLARPLNRAYGTALLYDTDNHRFIGWDGKDQNETRKQTCYPLEDPVNKKFSFNTGNMDLVCMINTAFSNGVVYCIMQDGNKRHLYAINVSTDDFTQEGCYLDIQAPDFDKATCFSASSQYPVIYYAFQNKLYAYNYSTQEYQETSLDAKEEITMLTFHRFDHPMGLYTGICKNNDEKYAVYRERENRLIVGSYNTTVTDNNGGILRFYDIASPGTNLVLAPGWEYTGYAKIVDVKYKEIR